MSNLKQIGMAITQYTQDYDESWPYDPCAYPSTAIQGCNIGTAFGIWDGGGMTPISYDPFSTPQRWTTMLQPYIKSMAVFQEPSSDYTPSSVVPEERRIGYWTNGAVWMDPTSMNGALPGSRTESSIGDASANVITVYDNINQRQYGNIRYLYYRPAYLATGKWTDYGTFATSIAATRQGPHVDIFNALWADGHVKAVKHDALTRFILPPNASGNTGEAPFPR